MDSQVVGWKDPRALTAPGGPAEQPLQPWQCAFAEWLSRQDTRPSVVKQREVASTLAKRAVGVRTLAQLKRNSKWIAYFQNLQLDALRRARAMLEARYEQAVEAHFDGMAMAVMAEDYRAVPNFTVPILDRIAPKRDVANLQTQVNIVLTTKQAEAMAEAADVEVLDAEVIADEDGGPASD